MESKKKKILFRRKLFATLAEEATMCEENLLNLREKYLQFFFHFIIKLCFTANNLAIKRRRKEDLSKRITKLPGEHDNSNK